MNRVAQMMMLVLATMACLGAEPTSQPATKPAKEYLPAEILRSIPADYRPRTKSDRENLKNATTWARANMLGSKMKVISVFRNKPSMSLQDNGQLKVTFSTSLQKPITLHGKTWQVLSGGSLLLDEAAARPFRNVEIGDPVVLNFTLSEVLIQGATETDFALVIGGKDLAATIGR